MSTIPELPLPIATERLILRERAGTDARALARLANDGRISRNLGPMFPYPYTLADAEAFLAMPADTFAIQLASGTGELIGMIGSIGPAARFGVVRFGYWLRGALLGKRIRYRGGARIRGGAGHRASGPASGGHRLRLESCLFQSA